nr:outer membrane protein [Marinicella sp. W31]MDC2877072.1 porin family protein [Marinicella sp. W31]
MSVLIAALLSSAIPSAAADVISPPPAPPPLPVPEMFKWTGIYFGALAGYHWTDAEPQSFRLVDDHLKIDNWLGGGFVGANYQFDNHMVLGLEGEFDYLGGSGDQSLQVVINNNIETGEGELTLGWSGSLRGRVGYGFERTLLYGTAGGEISSGSVTGSFNAKSIDTGNKTLAGWTVGAGLEHAFTDNFFARAEYRYSYYPKVDYSFSWDSDFSLKASQNQMKVGLGYKF